MLVIVCKVSLAVESDCQGVCNYQVRDSNWFVLGLNSHVVVIEALFQSSQIMLPYLMFCKWLQDIPVHLMAGCTLGTRLRKIDILCHIEIITVRIVHRKKILIRWPNLPSRGEILYTKDDSDSYQQSKWCNIAWTGTELPSFKTNVTLIA